VRVARPIRSDVISLANDGRVSVALANASLGDAAPSRRDRYHTTVTNARFS